MDIFTETHDIAFPLKQKRIPKRYLKRSVWMTNGLLQSSITKSKLFMKKLKKPSNSNINRYKQYCKLYSALLRHAKNKYFQDQLESAKYDMKKTWKLLRTATQTETYKVVLLEYFTINNTKTTNKRNISESFNSFFANIGNDVKNSVPQSQKSYSHYLNHRQEQSFFFDPVYPNDIISILSKLKPKTSRGNDGISMKLITESIDHIIFPLTRIINQSMSTGLVPTNMKIAKVIPIWKQTHI